MNEAVASAFPSPPFQVALNVDPGSGFADSAQRGTVRVKCENTTCCLLGINTRIAVVEFGSCGSHSGISLLERIKQLSDRLGLPAVIVDDESGIEFRIRTTPPTTIGIDLRKLGILSSGMSFYNKRGFLPANWDRLSSAYTEFIAQDVSALNLGNPKYAHMLMPEDVLDIDEWLGEQYPSRTPASRTIQYVFSRIARELKQMGPVVSDPELYPRLRQYHDLINRATIPEPSYNMHDLTYYPEDKRKMGGERRCLRRPRTRKTARQKTGQKRTSDAVSSRQSKKGWPIN